MQTNPEKANQQSVWLSIDDGLAAIGASACCVGPLLLVSLGIGGAWMGALTSMEVTRPFFIALTLIFLVFGYRRLYLFRYHCKEDDACAQSGVRRRQRVIFWTGSTLILLLLAFHRVAPIVYAAADVGQQNTIQVVTLDIQNMTCPLCQFTIKKALQNVNGVQRVTVDYDSKTAEVDFDPRQTDVQALIKASTDADYPETARRTSQ